MGGVLPPICFIYIDLARLLVVAKHVNLRILCECDRYLRRWFGLGFNLIAGRIYAERSPHCLIRAIGLFISELVAKTLRIFKSYFCVSKKQFLSLV